MTDAMPWPSEDEIIRLTLQDGPVGIDGLARAVCEPRRIVTQRLLALQRAGFVRRLSHGASSGQWALASYRAPKGRPKKNQPCPPRQPTRITACGTRVVNGIEYELVSLDALQEELAPLHPGQGSKARWW